MEWMWRQFVRLARARTFEFLFMFERVWINIRPFLLLIIMALHQLLAV